MSSHVSSVSRRCLGVIDLPWILKRETYFETSCQSLFKLTNYFVQLKLYLCRQPHTSLKLNRVADESRSRPLLFFFSQEEKETDSEYKLSRMFGGCNWEISPPQRKTLKSVALTTGGGVLQILTKILQISVDKSKKKLFIFIYSSESKNFLMTF